MSTIRHSMLAGAMLVLTACGSSAPSAAGAEESSSPTQASHSAGPAVVPSPTPSAGASALVAVSCEPTPRSFDPAHLDLTGAWAGDDGGIYYLRQVGPVVWWSGMSDRSGAPSDLGRQWNNVGRGRIDALTIEVDWADVPRGEILGDGTLTLKIEDDGTGNVQIVKTDETGTGFGNSLWTPCGPG